MQESKNVPLSSDTLLLFYKNWMAHRSELANTANGLCVCLGNFAWEVLYPKHGADVDMFWEMREALGDEMMVQFIYAGLSKAHLSILTSSTTRKNVKTENVISTLCVCNG